MDRAREFQTDALEAWAAGRDIEVTRTQGSDPAGNGTAERAGGQLEPSRLGSEFYLPRQGSSVEQVMRP